MIEHGFVTGVRVDSGVPICSVRLANRMNNEPRDIPVSRMHHGVFMVPEEGQRVQIFKEEDQRFIIGVLNRNSDGDNPSVSDGEMAFQLDADTYVKFEKDGSGSYNVSIKASGDVNIDASGNVYIDGIDFDQHVHDYDDSTINDTSGGTGSESSTTKTTDPPA